MNKQLYIPILKCKQSERKALMDLNKDQKESINPLLQLVHKYSFVKNKDGTKTRIAIPKDKTLEIILGQINKDLSLFNRIYFDARPLYSSITDKILIAINFTSTGLFGNNIVPVLYLDDISSNQYDENSKDIFAKKGICLRVSKEDLTDGFWELIDKNLAELDLKRSSVDIIFDFKVHDKNDINPFCENIKNAEGLNLWRSITFASGAFRKDFIGMDPDTYYDERLDWSSWLYIKNMFKDVISICYSDYAIQYPIYTEPVENSYPTRTLIYTTEEKWVIARGQGDNAKGSAKSKQYFAHARVLIEENILIDNCCNGEPKIKNVGKSPDGEMGNYGGWLEVGIYHHLVLTLKQISKLN